MSVQLSPQEPLFLAVKLAQERGLLPTAMSSSELQEFTLRAKERLFFSARTTNLWYVDKLKGLVERYTQGEGRDNDLAQLRIEARKLLVQAGYTPDAGFPGDAALGIPNATAGSLRDLSSEKRLNLIYETQAQTMRGLGMKLRGMSRIESQPAWELVRYKQAREKEWERDWMKRWTIAGDNVDWQGALKDRMIALQTSPIWLALGSSALFNDALNVDHPPFAFNSGMGWRAVGFRECEKIGLTKPPAEETETEMRAMIRAYMDRPFFDLEKDLKRRGMKVPDALKSTFKPKPLGPDSADTARLARLQILRRKFDENNARRAKMPPRLIPPPPVPVSAPLQQVKAAPATAVKRGAEKLTTAQRKADAVTAFANEFGCKVGLASPAGRKGWGAKMSDNAAIKHLEVVGDEWRRMRAEHPNMPASVDTFLCVASKRGRAHRDGPSPAMAVKAVEWTEQQRANLQRWEALNGRAWSTERHGNIVRDNFRHELAHTLSTPEVMRAFLDDVLRQQGGLEWFRKHVSEYAATNDAEAIAEAFGVATRSDYVRGTFPPELERFIFETMLGGQF